MTKRCYVLIRTVKTKFAMNGKPLFVEMTKKSFNIIRFDKVFLLDPNFSSFSH